jgi:hypothetical protein
MSGKILPTTILLTENYFLGFVFSYGFVKNFNKNGERCNALTTTADQTDLIAKIDHFLRPPRLKLKIEEVKFDSEIQAATKMLRK